MTGESAGEATDAPTGSKAVEPAAAATPAAGGSGSGAGVPAAPREPAPPPYTGPPPAKPRKQRVPVWAGAVLAALPLWAVLYGGAFGERSSGEAAGAVEQGALVYRASGCSTCHGANGGGGVGPAMDGVLEQFPAFADQVEWVKKGSAPVKGQPYGAKGSIATGGMPGFETSLSEEEIVAVVCHERVTLAGGEVPPECEEGATGTEPDAGEGGGGGGGEGDADSASASD